MDERLKFVARRLAGEPLAELCREFGISRKTGNKFLERYKRLGPSGLEDLTRRPAKLARQSSPQVQKLILDLKGDKPTWGAAKIREYLIQKNPGVRFPVRSTLPSPRYRCSRPARASQIWRRSPYPEPFRR